ncbi:hypothetical protein GRJ2_003153200 [Grus japonensis]|uniref:Uncharacterized protein n=1 Tax=Grus japonensis TaxID=30415 RepID=A0ABC9YAC7_GRUJA
MQDIAARLEKLVVKVHHVDAHVPKSRATEEHQNNQQVDQAAKIEVAQVDLDWQCKGELFIAEQAHDTSGHQGRDATYRWAHDRGVDLSMEAISQVIHQCDTCAAKWVKPVWYGGQWLKYKHGEAWQIDYITLPQTRQGKCYVLTMVEATTGWLETYPVPHATARNTILGLEKQVLWRHGTPERIESDNGTHFRNNLIDTWAKEHGIEWVYHIPYHAPASGKIKRYNGLLKATLRAMGGGTLKHWDTHLAKATCYVKSQLVPFYVFEIPTSEVVYAQDARSLWASHNGVLLPLIPEVLIGLALASGGSILELAGIGSVRPRGSFWQLLTEATPVAPPPHIPKPCHANPTQQAQIGNPNRPGILEVITDWPEGKDFGILPEEEVTHAEEAPPYNKLPEDEKPCALFTDGSCHIVGKHQRWKAAVWSPTRRVAEAAEGQGESSQFAEVKAIQLALDIAEREKWPTLYLYTASWMVANALWGWLQQWKQSNWQHKGKPIWAAKLWQEIAAQLEKQLVAKVCHVDAHVPKSRATEEHQNNQQVDQAAKIEVAQVDLDWQHKGELFIARWVHDTLSHQGRDAA